MDSAVLSYTPTAEYRMIDLNNSSSEKLNNLDITVYWKDQYSNLHPLYLQPGCKCDLKIYLGRRSYKNVLLLTYNFLSNNYI